MDNTFILCSVEAQFKADHCAVYNDHTGEILADGLFVLDSGAVVSQSNFRYIAFGDRGIYLDDLRILYQRTASERDPRHHEFAEKLRTVAGGDNVQNCSKSDSKAAIDGCILTAFRNKRPFYAVYFQNGDAEFSLSGLAGDAEGNIYEIAYSSRPVWAGRIKDAEILDGGHMLVRPCPKPVTLETRENFPTCRRSDSIID